MEPVARPTLEEIEGARPLLEGVVVPTALVPIEDPEDAPPDQPPLWIQPEVHQVVGSFKIRGVFHAVARMTASQRARGLLTVSAGNTAQALAWCGRHFGVEARALMPEGAPAPKIEAVRALGGTPVLVSIDEVFRFLQRRGWEKEPQAFVHPWIERDVMIGHGTLGLEILDACRDVQTVYVPVGGGGLLGGVGSAIKARAPGVRIVAVEPRGCPSFHAALEAGAPVTVPCDTICDGVAVPYMTEEVFPLLRDLVDDCVLVSEELVRSTIRRLALRSHLVAEGAGALAPAAALAASPGERGRAVALLTGGSIERSQLVEILSAEPNGS